MIVVCDTSPLNYLVLIRCVNVLPSLFGRDARTPPLAGQTHALRLVHGVPNPVVPGRTFPGYFFNEIFAGGSFNVPCHWLGKAAFISAGGSPVKVAVRCIHPCRRIGYSIDIG